MIYPNLNMSVMNNTHSRFIQIKYDNPEASFAGSCDTVEVTGVINDFTLWKAGKKESRRTEVFERI